MSAEISILHKKMKQMFVRINEVHEPAGPKLHEAHPKQKLQLDKRTGVEAFALCYKVIAHCHFI